MMAQFKVYPLSIPEVERLIEEEGLKSNAYLVEYERQRSGGTSFVCEYKKGVILIPNFANQAFVFLDRQEFLDAIDGSAKEAAKLHNHYKMINSEVEFRAAFAEELAGMRSILGLSEKYTYTFTHTEMVGIDEMINALPFATKWYDKKYYRTLLAYSISWIEKNTPCRVELYYEHRAGTFLPMPITLRNGEIFDWGKYLLRDFVEQDHVNLEYGLSYILNNGCGSERP